MSSLTEAIDNLVTATRILARENVVDAFGHISMRHRTMRAVIFSPVPETPNW